MVINYINKAKKAPHCLVNSHLCFSATKNSGLFCRSHSQMIFSFFLKPSLFFFFNFSPLLDHLLHPLAPPVNCLISWQHFSHAHATPTGTRTRAVGGTCLPQIAVIYGQKERAPRQSKREGASTWPDQIWQLWGGNRNKGNPKPQTSTSCQLLGKSRHATLFGQNEQGKRRVRTPDRRLDPSGAERGGPEEIARRANNKTHKSNKTKDSRRTQDTKNESWRASLDGFTPCTERNIWATRP